MSEKRQLPAFGSEAEEAAWWFAHREPRDGEFTQAIRDGSAGRNTLESRVARSLKKNARPSEESPLPGAAPQSNPTPGRA